MEATHTLEEYVMSQTVWSRVSEINYHTLVSQCIVPVAIPPLNSDVNLDTVNRIIVRISALDRLENLVHSRMRELCRSFIMMYIFCFFYFEFVVFVLLYAVLITMCCSYYYVLFVLLCAVHITMCCSYHYVVFVLLCAVRITMYCSYYYVLFLLLCAVHITMCCSYYYVLFVLLCVVSVLKITDGYVSYKESNPNI